MDAPRDDDPTAAAPNAASSGDDESGPRSRTSSEDQHNEKLAAQRAATANAGHTPLPSSTTASEGRPHFDGVAGKQGPVAAGAAGAAVSAEEPPPFRADFWSKDPATSEKRRAYLRAILLSVIMITIVIYGVLSIYWGALWKTDKEVHKIHGWVVDFDGSSMGASVRSAFMNITGAPNEVTWTVVNPSSFPNGPQDVANAVVNEKVWVAVVVNPGSTDRLAAAITQVDGSYNGSSAVTAFTNPARNNGAQPYYTPWIQFGLQMAASSFAIQNARQLASRTNANLQTLLLYAPSTVTSPLGFTMVALRQFDVPLAVALQFIGLIYLLIISFMLTMMNYQARVIATNLERHLKLRSLILLRILVPFICYFFISLFFSLLSLAFKAPFDRVFGKAGFVIFWMMNFCGMLALGFAIEALITILTPAFIPFFLVLWIIVNVAVAVLPIELLPGIYKYGYASPFYNVAQAVRTILFNTRNRLGLNFGVQLAWFGVSVFTMTLFTILIRIREQRKWKKERVSPAPNPNAC